MATRMQQRRGTASQWTSTNAGAGPVLNAGEIGWESDTNRFKIGDGVNNWSNLDYFADINSTVNPAFGTSITFEGATADSYETVLQVTDPTADRTITLPNVTGTVITTGNLSDITDIGVFTSTIVMEGSTADAHELTLSAGDPTADRTITFPDATGTVQLRVTDVSDTEIGYLNGVTSAIQTQLDDKSTASKTETLTNKTITSPVISSITNGAATLTLPSSTGTIALTTDIPAGVVTESGTQTLTNKTLTSPVVSGLTISDGSIVLEGATANDFETTLTVTDPTADRTITFPDATGTVAFTDSPTFTGTVVLPSTVNGPSASTSVNLLFPSTSGHITLGGSQTSGNLTLGGGSGRTTGVIGIGTGATASGTKTIDIGTGSTGGTTAITVGSSSGATSNITLNGTVTAANNLVVTGDLTVNGTTTTINSTTLAVDDKNITLGDVATPSDITADGGGITLKGATDKTFNWVDATDSWTSSEHINLASAKELKINGTSVLSGSTLGSGVTGSSLTSVGTITSGTWTGTTIAIANGGTGATTASTAAAALLPDQASNSGKYLTTDGSGTLSWGTVSGYSAPTLGSTSIASGATVTSISGLTLSGATLSGSLTAGGGTGTAGQVLKSTGSGVEWTTPSGGAAFSEFMLIGA